jgi:pyruvate,water dikinase
VQDRPFRASLRKLVRDRQREYERLACLEVPNLVLETEDGIRPIHSEPQITATEEDGLVLRGQPVSSGMVEGEVRVVRRPDEAIGVEPGTILVLPVVGPSWGPLYSVAGGLIIEMGGNLSHGAILAREYGLPAVTNIPGATRALRSGDRVFLNANTGIIWRAPERPQRAAVPGRSGP